MSFELFIQYLINGIALGSLYALIAIGYTIIYGVVGLINMAHGEFFMVAAFLAMWGVSKLPLPWYLSYTISTVITVLLGLLVEKVAYKPLRKVKVSSFIGAISVSFLLQNLFVVLFTSRSKQFPHPEFLDQVLYFGNISLPVVNIAIVIVSSLLFLILSYIVSKTKMGRAMDTTIFVKNGPCMAGLGLGGEGYASFSIATPTGEGITTPLTFTRERRCSMIDDLRILGKP